MKLYLFGLMYYRIFKDKLKDAENDFEHILNELSQINIGFDIKWEKSHLKDYFDYCKLKYINLLLHKCLCIHVCIYIIFVLMTAIVKCLVNDENLKTNMPPQHVDFNSSETTIMPMNQVRSKTHQIMLLILIISLCLVIY